MAFETGSATDVYDLLDKLRAFAAGQGWTVNRWAGGDELCLEHNGGYWNCKAVDDLGGSSPYLSGYRANAAGIRVRGSTGFDSNSAWDAQPNASTSEAGIGVFVEGDVKTYWFFSDAAGSYIHVAARISADTYCHLSLGHLTKLGSWTGGQYLAGTIARSNSEYPIAVSFAEASAGSGTFRADIDGATNAWQSLGGAPSGQLECLGAFPPAPDESQNADLLGSLIAAAPASWNGRAPLWPCMVLLQRPSSRYSIAGYPDDQRVLNIEVLTPEQTLAIGSDEWLVFPFTRKHGGDEASRLGGFAYRKIT